MAADITLMYLSSSFIDAWMFSDTALPIESKDCRVTFESKHNNPKEKRETSNVYHLQGPSRGLRMRVVYFFDRVDCDDDHYNLDDCSLTYVQKMSKIGQIVKRTPGSLNCESSRVE